MTEPKKNAWIKSSYPGVRYREHPTRKISPNAPQKDRYYTIRYKFDGKEYNESVGWASAQWYETMPDGSQKKCRWDEKRVASLLSELQTNQRTGSGPRTLKEMRELYSNKLKEEAQRKEEEALEATRLAEEEAKRNITFGKVWAMYSEEASRSKKETTWKRESQIWRNWLEPILINYPISKLNPALIKTIETNVLREGRSERTAQYVLHVIRHVFNWAKSQTPQIVSGDNPVTLTKKVPVRNKRYRYLTLDEATLLLDELKKHGEDSHAVHDICLLSLHCGLRFGEIASLIWGDINFENNSIYIKPSNEKSNRGRTVYMTSHVKEPLQERLHLKETSMADLIFPNRNGSKRIEMSHLFDKAVQTIGLNESSTSTYDKVVFHTLRHTCASWMVINGASLYQVQQLLGHSDYAMTTRYAHLAPDNIKAATNILEKCYDLHITKTTNISEVSTEKSS
jgi:integrase